MVSTLHLGRSHTSLTPEELVLLQLFIIQEDVVFILVFQSNKVAETDVLPLGCDGHICPSIAVLSHLRHNSHHPSTQMTPDPSISETT